MSAIKFTANTSGLDKKLARIAAIKAEEFQKELDNYAEKTLTECTRNTPVRAYSKIYKAQVRQYRKRVDYIPSNHYLADPSFYIREDGERLIYCEGRWYNAKWKLPDRVWGAYQSLLSERERRLRTPFPDFFEFRVKARFLYQKSWSEIAESLGLSIRKSDGVRKAGTRRKPIKQLVYGYGKRKATDTTYLIVMVNPLLEIDSQYKAFNTADIFFPAAQKHREVFKRSLHRKMKQLVAKI